MKIGNVQLFGRSEIEDSGKYEFFTRTDIDDVSDPGNIYLTRWHLVKSPHGGLYLHAIRRPDADRSLHNHPWSFAALVLKGGYTEEMLNGKRHRGVGSLRKLRAKKDYHRIDGLDSNPTWTLVFVGPKRCDWGFLTHRGWVRWDEYLFSGEFTDEAGRLKK